MTSKQFDNLKTHCRISFDGKKWYLATVKNSFCNYAINPEKSLVKPHLAIIDGVKINVRHFSYYECKNYQRKKSCFLVS